LLPARRGARRYFARGRGLVEVAGARRRLPRAPRGERRARAPAARVAAWPRATRRRRASMWAGSSC